MGGPVAGDGEAAWWEELEPVVVRECHLVGARRARERGDLWLTSGGLEYSGTTRTTIEWSAVTAITVGVEPSTKVTATRLLSEGVLGLAATRTGAVTVIHVEAGFASDSFTTTQPLAEVQRLMSPVLTRLEGARPSPTAAAIDDPDS